MALKRDMFAAECRICLQQIQNKSKIYSLFEAWDPPWDGMEATVAEDLNKLTHIQATETDMLSNIICEPCYDRLHSACYFVKLVQKNDRILKHSVHIEIDIPTKIGWPQPIQLDKNVTSNIYNSAMQVEVKQEVMSEEEFDNRSSEMCLDAMEVKVEPEEITPQNSVCNRISVGASGPQAHGETKRSNGYLYEEYLDEVKEEKWSDDDSDLALDLPLDCLLCSKGFNSVSGLKAHVIAQHSYKTVRRKTSGNSSPVKRLSRHVCATCQRTFATSTDLMVHETCHNLVVCYVCKKNFDTFDQLTKHRPRCSQTKIKSKDARLKTLDDVKRVQPAASDTPDQPTLTCPSCPEQFTGAYYLSIHREIHHSTPYNELNDSSSTEQLASQSELSGAVDKVLEQVSESLGLEDDKTETSPSGEQHPDDNEPSVNVNGVLERMKKSLGMADDKVVVSSEENEQPVVNGDLEQVTGISGLEKIELANKNEPSDIAVSVVEQVGESVETNENDDHSKIEHVASEHKPVDTENKDLDRVSDTLGTEGKPDEPSSDQVTIENQPSDTENRVSERVRQTLATEEKIENQSNEQVKNKHEPLDIANRIPEREPARLPMEEDKIEAIVNEIVVKVDNKSDLKSVKDNTECEEDSGSVNTKESVNEVIVSECMDIETESTGCRNIVQVVNEDTELVNKLLDSRNVTDQLEPLDDFSEAVKSEEFLSGNHNNKFSGDAVLESQIQGMEIDNMETVNQTSDSAIAINDNVKDINVSSENITEN